MAEANRPGDSEIFDGGPPLGLEKSLGLIKPNERRSVQQRCPACSLHGHILFSFIYVIVAVVILSLVLFVGPLLVFGGKLVEARRRGILHYGGLAEAVGRQLERKWLDDGKNVDEGALDVPHFSATTDLYQVVSNVYQMKTFPIDTQDLIALIVVTLLPFLPALLFEIPLDEVLADLMKVMF
jgi:hypothetical protein